MVRNGTVIAAMLPWDRRRPKTEGALGQVFGGHLPFYPFLANNQAAKKQASPR